MVNILLLYLTKLDFKSRIIMTKFRCSVNKLPANKNRFSNEDADRLCTLCDLEDRGDEYHYLFNCCFFENQHKIYLKRYYRNRPNTLKMKELFDSTNNKEQSNLIKFIKEILSNFH